MKTVAKDASITNPVNVMATPYGATGDGSTDDYASLVKAVAAAGNDTLYFPPGTYRIGTDLTIGATIRTKFDNAAMLKPDAGVQVQILGPLDAPISQIFSVTNTNLLSDADSQFSSDTGNWTKGTGWTIAGGVATHASGSASYLTHTQVAVAGKTYMVKYDITAGTYAKYVRPYIGGVAGITNTTIQTHIDFIIATATTSLRFLASDATWDGSIDNVVVYALPIVFGYFIDKIYPQWFGAVGDGASDDTSAIQTALNGGGRHIHLIPGTYKVTAPSATEAGIIVPHGNKLTGGGMNATTIVLYGGGDGIWLLGKRQVAESPNLSDFKIYTNTDAAGTGIKIWDDILRATVERVMVCLGIYNTTNRFSDGITIYGVDSYYNTIDNCHIRATRYGIYLNSAGAESAGPHYTQISNNTIAGGTYSVYVNKGNTAKILGNSIESFATEGIYIDVGLGHIIGENYMEGSPATKIELGATVRSSWVSRNFYSGAYGPPVVDGAAAQYGNSIIPQDMKFFIEGLDSDRGDMYAGKISADLGTNTVNAFRVESGKGNLILSAPASSYVEFEDTGLFSADLYCAANKKIEMNSPMISSPAGGLGFRAINRLKYSEEFDNAIWTATNATVSANSMTSPTGKFTADTITSTVSSGRLTQSLGSMPAGTTIRFSIWLKCASSTQTALITIGDSYSSVTTNVTVTTTWQKFTTTYTVVGTSTGYVIIYPKASGTGSIYAWGAHVTYDTTTFINTAVTEDTDNDFTSSGGNADGEWYAVKFTAAATGYVDSVAVNLKKTGSPAGTMTASIYSSDGGSPALPNAIIGSASNTVTNTSLNASGAQQSFTWTTPDIWLTSGTDYFVVLKTSGYTYVDTTTEVIFRTDADGGTNVCTKYDANAVPTWTTMGATVGADVIVLANEYSEVPYIRTTDKAIAVSQAAIVGSNVIGRRISGCAVAMTYATTIAVDMDEGNVFTWTVVHATGHDATINFTGGIAGQRNTFIITKDADTDASTMTWGTNSKGAATALGTVASKIATIDFVYDGTNWCKVSETTGM